MDIEDIHKNTKILIDGTPYNVDEAEFVKPGKGRAIYRLKLRNLVSGGVIDRTYHSSDTIEEVHISSQDEQFLYKEGDHYVFMDTETFEQEFIGEEHVGDKKNFLKEGTVVTVQRMGDRPLDITLPITVDLAVVKTELATKTATITSQDKKAVLETGYTIGVPTFIREGDIIKVDTRTGKYMERVVTKK
jgi:elongation factor P